MRLRLDEELSEEAVRFLCSTVFADATGDEGSTLESVIILAEWDKKCLFINVPGITHFNL